MFSSNKNTTSRMNSAQKVPSASAVPHRQHPHLCLFGTMHLTTAMKLIIVVGLLTIAALCTIEAIYLRRALIAMILPLAVCLVTVASLCRSDPRLLWPVVGISFFHLFLDGHLIIAFLFIFFFKPVYILMVLNWAFDTLHTTKTLSFYVHSSLIFTLLLLFFAFNIWQLRTALRFQTYLEELASSSSASGSTSSSSAGSEAIGAKANGIEAAAPKISEPFLLERAANGVPVPHQCKILNEPPIVLLGDVTCNGSAIGCVASTARRRSRSPGACRNAHSVHQQSIRVQQHPAGNGIYAQLGGRRPSLREHRHFGTNGGETNTKNNC